MDELDMSMWVFSISKWKRAFLTYLVKNADNENII